MAEEPSQPTGSAEDDDTVLTEDGIKAMSLDELVTLLEANEVEIPAEHATSQEDLAAWVITQFSS